VILADWFILGTGGERVSVQSEMTLEHPINERGRDRKFRLLKKKGGANGVGRNNLKVAANVQIKISKC